MTRFPDRVGETMDRKTLLAVLLSLIVVIVFQTFFFPKEEPAGTRSRQAVTDSLGRPFPASEPSLVSPTEGSVPRTEIPVSSATGWSGAETETEMVVETGIYTAIFTNRGGMLRSFKLKGFADPVGQPVEIVLGPREVGLVIEGRSDSGDLDNTLFAGRQESLGDGRTRIVFEASNGAAGTIRKVFTLDPDEYLLELDIELSGLDAEGYRITWNGGIPRGEKLEKSYEQAAGTIVLLGKNKETIRPKEFKKVSSKEVTGNVRWAGVRNKYFMAVMIPPEDTSSRVIAVGDHEAKITGAQIVMPMRQGKAQHGFLLYVGPMEYNRLKGLGHNLDAAVDLGWKVFRPVSKLLLASMVFIHKFVPNYGVVIILISLLTKLIFYPLTRTSMKSMRAMQKVQPEITALREKYKKDPQKLQAATMEMYKKHKVNPVGGCLPMLVQMPVFIGLYQVLANDIAVRNAPFVWWINDLSSPDVIFSIGSFPIHVVPIILFIFTALQTLLTPQGDPRQKMMGYMMPLVTLFIFYSFPAGLALYWTVNSILTVAQQWMIHREDPTHKPAAA